MQLWWIACRLKAKNSNIFLVFFHCKLNVQCTNCAKKERVWILSEVAVFETVFVEIISHVGHGEVLFDGNWTCLVLNAWDSHQSVGIEEAFWMKGETSPRTSCKWTTCYQNAVLEMHLRKSIIKHLRIVFQCCSGEISLLLFTTGFIYKSFLSFHFLFLFTFSRKEWHLRWANQSICPTG